MLRIMECPLLVVTNRAPCLRHFFTNLSDCSMRRDKMYDIQSSTYFFVYLWLKISKFFGIIEVSSKSFFSLSDNQYKVVDSITTRVIRMMLCLFSAGSVIILYQIIRYYYRYDFVRLPVSHELRLSSNFHLNSTNNNNGNLMLTNFGNKELADSDSYSCQHETLKRAELWNEILERKNTFSCEQHTKKICSRYIFSPYKVLTINVWHLHNISLSPKRIEFFFLLLAIFPASCRATRSPANSMSETTYRFVFSL